MARQISAIKFVGTLGNLVGSSGIDGKTIIREKAASVANPQTKDQMNQRAKMKLAAKVAGMLGEVGQLSLKANGFKTTRRGTLIKDLLEKISVTDQVAEMPRQLSLVKSPMAVSLPDEVTVYIDEVNNVISGNITGLPTGTLSAKALLLFNRNTEQWDNISTLDAGTTLSMAVADQNVYDVYFYAEVVMPTTTEGRAKLNNLLGVNPGYKVAVNRLDASNYGYSRTFNAGIVNGVKYDDKVPASNEAIINSELTTLAEGMASTINIGLAASAQQDNVSIQQEFINLNYDNINPAATAINRIDWEKIIVSQGELTPVALGEANFTTPLTVSVPIDDSYSDPRFNKDEDRVYIVVYSKTNGSSILSAPKKRIETDNPVTVTLPSYWQGHYVEVFGFVQSVDDPTLCSDSIYCGSGRIA